MTEIMLKGALSALKTKIEALAASETATAEDLALLGTALERIAGKTTAIEVQILGDEQKAAITSEAQAARIAALDAITAAVAAADAVVAELVAQVGTTVTQADADVDAAVAEALNAIAVQRDTVISAVAATKTGAVDEVLDAAAAAISTAGGLTATNFFFNQI